MIITSTETFLKIRSISRLYRYSILHGCNGVGFPIWDQKRFRLNFRFISFGGKLSYMTTINLSSALKQEFRHKLLLSYPEIRMICEGQKLHPIKASYSYTAIFNAIFLSGFIKDIKVIYEEDHSIIQHKDENIELEMATNPIEWAKLYKHEAVI